jgi:hypothetical protein
MKLDEELVRALLLHVEQHATLPHSDLDLIEIEGRGDAEITYHLEVMAEAGLLKATIDKLPDGEDPAIVHVAYSVHRLTYEGHELLAAVRETRHWREVKRRAGAVGTASVRSLMKVAEAYLVELVTRT